jgi:hypothetical protein
MQRFWLKPVKLPGLAGLIPRLCDAIPVILIEIATQCEHCDLMFFDSEFGKIRSRNPMAEGAF